MKILRTLLFVIQSHLLVSVLSSDKAPNLYQMPGLDVPMEFSDDSHRNQIERDMSQFDNLGTYQPKKYGELDHDSPNLHLDITQQIIERVKDNKHKDFFELTDNVKNSEPFRKGYAINYDQYYNNKTGKYERAFKSQEVTKALQNLHISDFNTQTENAKKQSTFIQTEAKAFSKRPSYLPNDAKTQFLEVSEEAKIAALKYDWQYLYSYNCWASSRWEFAFLFICWNWVWSTIYIMWIFPYSYLRPYANICIWIWFLSYPCSSSIGGRGITWFWMSEKMNEEGKMQPITFRQEFDVIRRVKFHNLLFMSVPDEVKIEISQDHKTWESATEFVKTPDRSRWWWWWWSYQYHYPPSTFAKSCKIIMKGLRKNWYGNRHGLWWVDFYTQTQTVQVMDKNPPGDPRCMARAEVGYYQTNKPFILMNCLDAILQNDSREAFFLNLLYIQQWADNMCIAGGDKHTKDSPQNVVSKTCRDNDEHKWIIDRLGRFMNKASPTTCIAAKEDNAITQVQTYGFVKVTASLSDSRINPYDTIDPNASGFWAAPLELKQATWEVIFDRQYMVEEITVQFKYPPKKVSVNVLTPENKWFTVVTEEPEDEMIVQMTPSQIIGVNIHMLELDLDKVTEFQRPAFGIKKVICKRPGTPMSYQTCAYQGKDSKLVNRFKIENIEYIDTSYLVPYKGAKAYMHVVYESTKVVVEQFIVKIQAYMVVLKVAEDINKNIQKLNKLIDDIYGQLAPYKKYVLVDEGKGGEAKGKCYACSVETAALACTYVKKKNPDRLNGFFWIKTKCMPAAARVYCDFEEADSNFYQYVGNYADKAAPIKYKTIEDLQGMCEKVGLQPVEILSKKQALNIIEYINLVDANSKDEIGIPFAYQWEYKFLGDKYQSLNSAKSKETTQFLKGLMEPQTMMDKLTTIGSDLLILKRSRNKLYKGYLSSFQLRGLVCSENKGTKEYKKGSSGSTCETTLAMMGSPKVNTILKIGCPADCSKSKGFKVIGTGPFSEFSSICRAAVYSGAINDVEGGLVEVKVVAGKETYKEGETNDIQAFEGTGSPAQKAFNVVKKPAEAACPNLKPKKKSFISFNDIIHKVKSKKSQSFIESREQIQNQDQLQAQVQDDDGASGEPGMDMKKAIGYVNKQLSKKLIIISKYAQFIKDTQLLFKKYELILAGIFGSSLNPSTQANMLSTTNLRITATKQMIEDLLLKGQAKLAGLMQTYLKKLDDLFFMQRYEPHHEKYQLDWQSTYTVMDSTDAKDGPSQWKFTKEDVYPHDSAIAQMKGISCGQDFKNPDGECTATIQQIKYKKFYDFKLTIDFKVRKMGYFGIVFRMKDQYNYYAVEFKNDMVQFRRMMEGKQKIISESKMDKILSDTWYNVQLLVVETVFKVMIGKEKKEDASNPKKYDTLKTALQGEDDYFKNGFQGLQTDGTLGYFIDHYTVEPIDCWKDPFNLEKAIKYLQPQSSRFFEVYKADINQVWFQSSNEEIFWEYVQNGQGRKKALKKDMNNQQVQKTPMILINKQMNKGWISFDVYLKSKTTEFSLILFYVNDQNYHEITMQQGKLFFKEMANGKKQIIKVEDNKKVKARTWYTVYIQINADTIETWFELAIPNKKFRIREILFAKELDRPQTKGSRVGISASKGTIFIDQFKFYPGKVPEPEDPNTDPLPEPEPNPVDPVPVPNPDPVPVPVPVPVPPPTFDYKICLNTTKTIQQNWCLKESEMPGPLADCKENFCIKCCDKQVGGKKNVAEKCVEECSHVDAEKDKSYYQCFNSKDPKHSVPSICSTQFPKKTEKHQDKQCKTDFCELCCITHPLILQKGMLKNDMDDCYKQCHEKFDK